MGGAVTVSAELEPFAVEAVTLMMLLSIPVANVGGRELAERVRVGSGAVAPVHSEVIEGRCAGYRIDRKV